MAHKDGLTAICPHFISRCNWRGEYWTECQKGKSYGSRQERDAEYRTRCCGDPTACKFYQNQKGHDHMKNQIANVAEKPAPGTMAARLAVIEYRIHEHMQSAAGHLLGVGQCLNEAKAGGLVPHGEWEAWVLRNTGFSVRQAQRMMDAARRVPEGSALAQLPFSKIQACLQLPSAEEAEAMAQRVQAEEMSLRQLQEEVKREKSRADELFAKAAENNARASKSQAEAIQAQQEVDRLRGELEAAKRTQATTGISSEARAEIDRLRGKLEEAESVIEQQAELRQQAQQELLNFKVQAARNGSTGDDGLATFDLAAAVRTFIGTAGVLPHMGTALARATDSDRQQVRGYVEMVADWVQAARQALDVVCISDGM